MRFTVHRPPCGEVSLCWYRPSGGDVAGSVHIGIARPGFTGDAGEDRLALAVFGCDVPTGRASLRRLRGRDPLNSARSLMVEPGHQSTPSLSTDRAIKAPLLGNTNARLIKGAARRACHRPHVEALHSNGVEPTRQIGRGFFHPVSSPVRLARSEPSDRQLGALSAVGATPGSRQALVKAAQPDLFTRCQAGGVQQLPSRQGRRHGDTTIDADHAAVPGSRDWAGDVGERDMPTTGPVPSDAIGLHTVRHGPSETEADPSDLGHPYPRAVPVEFFDVARLEPNLTEPFMNAGLAPRRSAMGSGEKILHSLSEIAQCLLLHRLRPGRQPVVFGADVSQLRRLFAVPRGAAAWLPHLLLLDGQVPHELCMPTMLQQHHLLCGCWHQPKPRHTRKIATATDNNGQCTPAHVGFGIPPRHNRPDFTPKEG